MENVDSETFAESGKNSYIPLKCATMSSDKNKTNEQPKMDINAEPSPEIQNNMNRFTERELSIRKQTTTLDTDHPNEYDTEDIQIDRWPIEITQEDTNLGSQTKQNYSKKQKTTNSAISKRSYSNVVKGKKSSKDKKSGIPKDYRYANKEGLDT
ncbi:hypothetical protein C2G38_2219123 [Gigaspora rosea]|uniref:Uncharacterized protein n=1 Tax=Gigaspora rosea TaxID=44941 RepID=A0A397U5S1_9GLOM|nr:hypothetical protein C2G38_2219123 [Gigaspora rosea]